MLVKNWMSSPVIFAEPDMSMRDAIHRLQEHRLNVLPVVDGGELVGIITDRDLKHASPSEATSLDMHELIYLTAKIRVADLMKRQLFVCRENDTIEEAAAILLEKRISGLPVIRGKNELVGIITRSDIFRVLISLTGLGKRGVQIAVQVADAPGGIKELREIVQKYGARTASILSSGERAPDGFLKVYLRIYEVDRTRLSAMMEEIGQKTTLLYMVDHREGRRILYERE
jgi:acetoin utilization protein AcuB